MKKFSVVMLFSLLIVAFFYSGLNQVLTLDGLKSGLSHFEAWRSDWPWLAGSGFFVLYVVVTALSLPGAVAMTLAAGMLFGVLWGTVIVSFASSMGATLAFLSSRYLFRKAVQRRFGKHLNTLNDGIRRDGAFYLFALRLVPVFPFFLINLLMGLTPIRTTTFYWVSQAGMLAGTIVYVNAGTQLAQLDSLAGIVSPAILTSFVLLGVFPILAKKVLESIQR